MDSCTRQHTRLWDRSGGRLSGTLHLPCADTLGVGAHTTHACAPDRKGARSPEHMQDGRCSAVMARDVVPMHLHA
eukprot:13595803-Alexandrium_andersonii.AAC.1